jgi:polyisoprenoid-binding protein YceI
MTTITHTPVRRTVAGVDVPLPGTYAIDASHTHVGFVVRHLMVSKTRGRFPALTGTVVIGDDLLASSVDVSIETTGVDTGDTARDGHLRSAAGFAASAEIDREEFGLSWNQVLEGGGFLVGKRVAIEIEAEAVLRA